MKTSTKTPLIIIAMASVMLMSFTPRTATPSAQQTATRMLAALQHASAEEFVSLYPSLADFHQVMDNNAPLYGNHLKKAKEDFQALYDNRLTAEMYSTFDDLQREGKKNGIDWNVTQYKSVEAETSPIQDFAPIAFTVTFQAKGKEYRLRVDRGFIVNGEYKVSPYVQLVNTEQQMASTH